MREASERVRQELAAAGIDAQVQGRPKHLYSIWKKMQGKGVDLASIYDLRALRVIVPDVRDCYAALSCVHARWRALPDQFNDYIAKPKANGYQSLHTVVLDDDGAPLEVQIRTRAMHEHAEYGVAAHWAYKEAGARGYAGISAAGGFEERVAQARKAVLRQLLAWERDHAAQVSHDGAPGFDDRIFVFTPQATVIELPAGATPVDFAYAVHTDLGHRCRGARVDGVMVPLNTPLTNGQTVEVTAIKEGGPSLDWLNAELGYLKSPRARAKVRAWFNARAQHETIARGRELVEKLLQREGRTALKLDELAARLGFKGADALFEVVGKDEFSLRHIETLLKPQDAARAARRCHRAAARQGQRRWRAGGGCRVADDDARTLLPAGAARSDRRLRHTWQGRGNSPQQLQQLPPDAACQPGARDCGRLGCQAGGARCGLSGEGVGGGRRAHRLAARHLRAVRQRAHERDGRALAGSGPCAGSAGAHGADGRSRQRDAAACRAGADHPHPGCSQRAATLNAAARIPPSQARSSAG